MIITESIRVKCKHRNKILKIHNHLLSMVGIHENTELFSCIESEVEKSHPSYLYLSTIPLSPSILYCRVSLRNEPGTLCPVTNALARQEVNIQNTTATSLKDTSIVELVIDVDSHERKLTARSLEKMLGTLRPDVIESSQPELITEIMPITSLVDVKKKLKITMGNQYSEIVLSPELCNMLNLTSDDGSIALVSAYSKIPALLISFFDPSAKLIFVEAQLTNTPGSLDEIAKSTSKEANMFTMDLIPLQNNIKLWRGYGELLGSIDALTEKLSQCSERVISFKIHPL